MKIKKVLALLIVLVLVVGVFAVPAAATVNGPACLKCGKTNVNTDYHFHQVTGQFQTECNVCHSTRYSAPYYVGNRCLTCGYVWGGVLLRTDQYCPKCDKYY